MSVAPAVKRKLAEEEGGWLKEGVLVRDTKKGPAVQLRHKKARGRSAAAAKQM